MRSHFTGEYDLVDKVTMMSIANDFFKKICLKVQFTEDSRNGTPGLRVARHVQEEFSDAFASAPIPGQPTEEETAVDWGQLQKQELVTHKTAL